MTQNEINQLAAVEVSLRHLTASINKATEKMDKEQEKLSSLREVVASINIRLSSVEEGMKQVRKNTAHDNEETGFRLAMSQGKQDLLSISSLAVAVLSTGALILSLLGVFQ